MHVVDQLGTLYEYENCGNCGTVQHSAYLGQTTKKGPCEDCIENGIWVKEGGDGQERRCSECRSTPWLT